MRVAPYYSKLPGTGVYHNDNRCVDGNNIERRNRRAGTNGLDLCERCRKRG